MGFFGTVYMFTGLSLITLSAFGVCSLARIFLGHRVAKRLHELLLGYGMYYWMRIAGYWHLRVLGNMPTSGAYVIVSNHATPDEQYSFMDHCLVSRIPLPKKYLTKRQYFTLPFFGWTQWIVGDVGVDVSSRESREQSLDQCRALLRSGDSVVLYPEGTRTPNPPTLRPFKDGAFRLAYECKVPILPVTLVNTHLAMRRGMAAGEANLAIHVGEPIHVNTVEDIAIKREEVARWMCGVLSIPYTPAGEPAKPAKAAITSSGPKEAASISWETRESAEAGKVAAATNSPPAKKNASTTGEVAHHDTVTPDFKFSEAVRTHPDNVRFAEDPHHHAHVTEGLSYAAAMREHPDPPAIDQVDSDTSITKADMIHHDRVTPTVSFARAVLENIDVVSPSSTPDQAQVASEE